MRQQELYSSTPLRRWLPNALAKGVPIILCILIFWNFLIFVLGVIATATWRIGYAADGKSFYGWNGNSVGAFAARFFMYCTVPLIICTTAIFDLYKWWRCSLRPVWIVLSSLASGAGVALCAGLWTPCIALDFALFPSYCPAGGGDGWRSASKPPPNVGYLLPWSCIFTGLFYIIYCLLGLIAWYRQRGALRRENRTTPFIEPYQEYDPRDHYMPTIPVRKSEKSETQVCNHCFQELPAQCRQHRVASSVFTSAETASLGVPSTIDSTLMSNATFTPTRGRSNKTTRTSLPPYGETDYYDLNAAMPRDEKTRYES